MRNYIITILAALIPLCSTAKENTVYHAVVKKTRIYNNIPRDQNIEYWFTKDKTCIVQRGMKTIVRKDLGLVYTYVERSNGYYLDSINVNNETDKKTDEINFRVLGQDRYSPDYEWLMHKEKVVEMLNDFKTTRFTYDGDADFDEVKLDFWLTKPKNGEMAELFNSMQSDYAKNNKTRTPLHNILSENKKLIPVQIIDVRENSISPSVINKTLVEKIEEADPPENIFELPEGAKKLN
ncbi:hypothetical protein ACFLTI_10410 [Bacteroidota bacterium]